MFKAVLKLGKQGCGALDFTVRKEPPTSLHYQNYNFS
jgi:hypothetical protein